MTKVNLTCIMCPMGCSLEVEKSNGKLIVTGNNCIRGEQYAKEELTAPKRIVTALVRTSSGVLPVKTTTGVPKKMMFQVVKEINKLNLKNPKFGEVVIRNVLGTGADVVITGEPIDKGSK